MRYTCLLLFAIVSFSCKKKEQIIPVVVPDASFQILELRKVSLTEYSAIYTAKRAWDQEFVGTNLQWSETADFAKKDTIAIILTDAAPWNANITGLKDSTKYFARLSALVNGQRVYSKTLEWYTEDFKVLSVNLTSPPWEMSKGDTLRLIKTNHPPVVNAKPGDSRVFIGNVECTVVSDLGDNVYFDLPRNLASGKYLMEVRKKTGMVAFTPDSVTIKRGLWSQLTAPELPLNYAAPTKGLHDFGTAYSSQKGYVVGGSLFNGLGTGLGAMVHEPILEFDPNTENWRKLVPANPRHVMKASVHHYNNALYVIGGTEYVRDMFGFSKLVLMKKMLRFDLGSLTWSELDSLPTYGYINMVDAELNGEWYIGMGLDSANLSVCCGDMLPNRKFFKYNPMLNAWTRLADYPGSTAAYPTFFVIGSKIYAYVGAVVVGQPSSAVFRSELWQYDPGTNQWSQLTLPATGGPPQGEKYQIVTYNGKAYFLTGQKYTIGVYFYFYNMQNPCLEWDPVRNTYTTVAARQVPDIMKLVFARDDKFYFQTDARGYHEAVPNKTLSFKIRD